ncbi:adenylate kinase [Spiroplasma floricola]|uniref:Adenylate kinase n=1 Tax=Spiroplasma floricola 23-6 TaxID=1336749 RepID=A0A2K8SF61_9MOLU|nr:adenylate kinase [Spiroplasma floricola]AUB32076.1 adenylate kinase [Spiroplasma floricola 23-6]
MNIILLGAPGSGKGTLSEFLCEKDNFTQLSTGDLFRENISNKTDLGIEAQKYMNDGNLVPDSVTNSMVENYLKTRSSELIFDGYPRTDDQAKSLDIMLKNLNNQIDKVIYLEINQDVLLGRLTGRMICKICKRSYHKINRKPLKEGICDFDGGQLITRPDDQENKIKTRLEAYHTQTAPLIEFYKSKIIKVDADKCSPEELYNRVKKVLGS